jgi:hypothetical protein
MLYHFLHFFLLKISNPKRNIILLHEHLVALKNMALPKVLLELREGIKEFEH